MPVCPESELHILFKFKNKKLIALSFVVEIIVILMKFYSRCINIHCVVDGFLNVREGYHRQLVNLV